MFSLFDSQIPANELLEKDETSQGDNYEMMNLAIENEEPLLVDADISTSGKAKS